MALRAPASRTSGLFGLVLMALGGLPLGGCTSGVEFPTELTPEEQRLVDEVLALVEVRIARARDAEEGAEKREQLPELYTSAELEAMMDDLSHAPERAQLVLGAVNDSLVAWRERLLPPTRDR